MCSVLPANGGARRVERRVVQALFGRVRRWLICLTCINSPRLRRPPRSHRESRRRGPGPRSDDSLPRCNRGGQRSSFGERFLPWEPRDDAVRARVETRKEKRDAPEFSEAVCAGVFGVRRSGWSGRLAAATKCHSIGDRRYWRRAHGHVSDMDERRRTASEDASADIGRRIDSRHEEDVRFFRHLRKRALRRSRALGAVRRRHSADPRIPPPRSSANSL
jgi:hypothetical protein